MEADRPCLPSRTCYRTPMPRPPGKTTAPAIPGTANATSSVALPALVVIWSKWEPHRVGQVAFLPFPTKTPLLIGRGDPKQPDKFAKFLIHRPGEVIAVDPHEEFFVGDALSGEQVSVESTGKALNIEVLGRCPTFVNGEPLPRFAKATIKPGDWLLFENELLLLCVLRPRTLELPAARPGSTSKLHAYGGPDADDIVGESPAVWALRAQIARLAAKRQHVLVLGETGTGKELVAAAIHAQSSRAKGPFVVFNVAGLQASVLAAELFGNLRNYPNAGMEARKGLVGDAAGGDLFIDEIGEFPIADQPMLLRLLENLEYHTLGDSKVRRIDLRIIGATNRDEASFRRDFYWRLKVRVVVPPLRERPEDIPLLIRHLMLQSLRHDPKLERLFTETANGRLEPNLSARLVAYLVQHPLLANMRELEGLLEEAIDASDGDKLVSPAKWSSSSSRPASHSREVSDGDAVSAEARKAELIACLDRAGGSVSRAARALGCTRGKVYRMMEEYGIKRDKKA